MEKRLVTVICATFNQEKYIRKALDGFLLQKTNFPYEIIVHDDASGDNTPNVIKEYADKFPDLIVPVLQKENQFSKGVHITKELLIPMARGKYIALCEGDDYWSDANKLQAQFDAMEQHPECSICVHRTQGISEDETQEIRTFPAGQMDTGVVAAEKIVHQMFAENEWVFHTTSYFFRKSDALDMNEKAFDFWKKPAYGDFAYMQMAALKGDFYYIDKVMSFYRMGSIGSTVRRDMNLNLRKQRNLRFINAISNFDRATNDKFHNDCMIAINRYTYAIAEIDKDYKVLLSPDMRRFWNERSMHVKVRIMASRWFPWVDKVYYALRKIIKGV